MAKLNDTELVILSASAQRDDGSILPLPRTLKVKGEAVERLFAGLKKKRFIAGTAPKLTITTAGRRAIGVEEGEGTLAAEHGRKPDEARPSSTGGTVPSASIRPGSKLDTVVNLLRQGATLAELIAATGWQAHSIRGAISGAVKKKYGFAVESVVVEPRGRVYRIVLEG